MEVNLIEVGLELLKLILKALLASTLLGFTLFVTDKIFKSL